MFLIVSNTYSFSLFLVYIVYIKEKLCHLILFSKTVVVILMRLQVMGFISPPANTLVKMPKSLIALFHVERNYCSRCWKCCYVKFLWIYFYYSGPNSIVWIFFVVIMGFCGVTGVVISESPNTSSWMSYLLRRSSS